MASKERGVWRVRWHERGRKMSQSFPAGTPKKMVDDFERKVRLGLIDRSLTAECPTLGDYAKHFFEVYPTLNPRKPNEESTTLKARGDFANHIEDRFGDMRLGEIKPRDVLKWQADLWDAGKGKKAQTIRNVRSLLSSILKLAVIEELIEYNPCRSIPTIAAEPSAPAFWSFDEKDRFLCTAAKADFELFQLAAFACDTGARIGELEGLLGDSLDLKGGFVEYRRHFCYKTRQVKDYTKNRVPRRVYLSPEIVDVMRNKAATKSGDRVFGLNFNTMPPMRLYPMCERAEVKRLTPHGWRHTFASHLIMLGREAKDVQTALGHTKIATTLDTYAHLLEDYKRGITDGMNVGMRWVLDANTKVVALGGRR